MLREFLIYLSAYIGLFAVIFYALSIRSRIGKKIPEFNEKRAPNISIIIPAYNEEKGIEATIKSALGVDYPRDKMEIIVVDDGSKDKTYSIASRFKSNIVKVFTKKNGGKGTALNLGLAKAKGEIVFTMDADSIIMPQAVKHQVVRFADPLVMCVSPVVSIYKPRNILERVQQIEYFLGIFLREAFTSLNAVHVTPGAFSAYRKSFFDKYGGFAENNLTEDFEMALRIQSKGFIIENSTSSIVYTIPPRKFKPLLVQRKRWYIGLIRNLSDYRRLFSSNYGALGVAVLPIAISTIIISVFLTLYLFTKAAFDLKKEITLLQSVNFNLFSTFEFTKYAVQRYFFNLFSDPIMLFLILFSGIIAGYMIYAKSKVKKHSNVALSLPLFILFYAFLFAFWWTLAFIYNFLNRNVKWR